MTDILSFKRIGFKLILMFVYGILITGIAFGIYISYSNKYTINETIGIQIKSVLTTIDPTLDPTLKQLFHESKVIAGVINLIDISAKMESCIAKAVLEETNICTAKLNLFDKLYVTSYMVPFSTRLMALVYAYGIFMSWGRYAIKKMFSIIRYNHY